MSQVPKVKPVDYLIIGHITIDQTPRGPELGGTATFSGLTAQALGLKAGILTSWGMEISAEPLDSITIHNVPSHGSTIFENVSTPSGRSQRILQVASQLTPDMIPEPWQSARIVHLAPVAQEVSPAFIQHFPNALVCLTPQGWLRDWGVDGNVRRGDMRAVESFLMHASAIVLSMEDIGGDETLLEEMASLCPVIAVTEGKKGVRLYWNRDVRRFKPPSVDEVDATGAGDIFAAAFFVRLDATRDPWESARFATLLAAYSVTRPGLSAIPTREEISACRIQVM